MTRILLLRHAPPLTGGRLAGRTEVDADLTDHASLAWMRDRIGGIEQVISSPARRCLQTATALGLSPDVTREALWEQHYGAWEGLAYADLPDLGRLDSAALARHRPDGGESFEDLAARVHPEIERLQSDTLIVCHAGVIRAALSLVVGHAALSFSVAPLSLTILHRQGDDWSVEAVNVTAP
ncbi:histidine phosphatase family protein [Paracoccus caeni]|uniref:histidine phosphatase family protein n=1 Tax=Paracoccus caeni TaxID=657651 RepID=UPI002D802B51|nr:histidine phosphatase family protein [Paracoccus caeni]